MSERPPGKVVIRLTEGDPRTVAAAVARGERTPFGEVSALPADPWDLSDRGLVCWAVVASKTTPCDVLRAAARGVDLVLRVELAGPGRSDLLDELRRIGDVETLSDGCRAAVLTDEQHRLLGLISGGAPVAAAGRELGLSRRTAYRRLEEIRAVLGAASHVDAVRKARAAGVLPP